MPDPLLTNLIWRRVSQYPDIIDVFAGKVEAIAWLRLGWSDR
jgi:hypothetical protein